MERVIEVFVELDGTSKFVGRLLGGHLKSGHVWSLENRP